MQARSTPHSGVAPTTQACESLLHRVLQIVKLALPLLLLLIYSRFLEARTRLRNSISRSRPCLAPPHISITNRYLVLCANASIRVQVVHIGTLCVILKGWKDTIGFRKQAHWVVPHHWGLHIDLKVLTFRTSICQISKLFAVYALTGVGCERTMISDFHMQHWRTAQIGVSVPSIQTLPARVYLVARLIVPISFRR